MGCRLGGYEETGASYLGQKSKRDDLPEY